MYTFAPLFFETKYREMRWVISVIYPVFLALIFHEFFFSKERYLFQDVAKKWAPLSYCVLRCLHNEGNATIIRAKLRLIRLFMQRIARSRNTRI